MRHHVARLRLSLIQPCASSPFPNHYRLRPPTSTAQTPDARRLRPTLQSSTHVNPCDPCPRVCFIPSAPGSQGESPPARPATDATTLVHAQAVHASTSCTPFQTLSWRTRRGFPPPILILACRVQRRVPRPRGRCVLHTSYITLCLVLSHRASEKRGKSRRGPHTGPVPAVGVPAAVPQISQVVWSHTLVL